MNIKKLYEGTNFGLDIILYYYPDAKKCVGDSNKHFKMRDENTASASIIPPDDNATVKCYKVCDFGDGGHAMSPIDIALKEENMYEYQMNELILMLGQRHNVLDALNKNVNKPRIEERQAKPGEKDGDRPFKLMNRIPEPHLKVFGHRVTYEHTDALNWFEAEYIGRVKKGKVTLKYSTEHYPIFMRRCVADDDSVFYKVYEPYNPDKGFRFSYAPAGAKPMNFINGWSELLKAIEILDAQREPENPEVTTLPEAFICSGERDAICCLSMGGQPLWFNSETYKLQPSEYEMIHQKVKTLYNIPDIDDTGIRMGTNLALDYLDIKTIWLPDWLKNFKDNRGRPKKDLHDFVEVRPNKSEFNSLKSTAMQARFWDCYAEEESKHKNIHISPVRLYYFLRLNGFYCLKDEDSDTTKFIRIKDNIVEPITSKDIKRFVNNWAEKHYLGENIRNVLVNSRKLSDGALEYLKEVDLNFINFTEYTQTMFFQNTVIEVSGEGLKEFRKGSEPCKCFVWKDNVIKHRVSIMKPMFKVDGDNLEILDANSSPFFGFLINASRLYWRKEMEYRFLMNGETEEAVERMQEYARLHKFCLDGECLDEKEINEQKLCLLNKLFVVGYMMHHYKSQSRPWAPIAMDNKIGDINECNGRTGKSFFFMFLAKFCKAVILSGRKSNLLDGEHVFDQVTKYTDFILVDDCSQYFTLSLYYDLISSDMTVNPKHNRIFTIPFDFSPKFAFSSNYIPRDFDSSSVARSLYMVFSDYYHEQSPQNDYRETRKISTDFGGNLFTSSYTQEQWNADINLLLQCMQFYLSRLKSDVKILPPMDNIFIRKKIQDVGKAFQDWGEIYFAPDSGNLNRYIIRREAFEDFRRYANIQSMPTQGFTKSLIAFCDLCPYIAELNPDNKKNTQNRMMKTVNGRKEEMIYLKAVDNLEDFISPSEDDFALEEMPESGCETESDLAVDDEIGDG